MTPPFLIGTAPGLIHKSGSAFSAALSALALTHDFYVVNVVPEEVALGDSLFSRLFGVLGAYVFVLMPNIYRQSAESVLTRISARPAWKPLSSRRFHI